MSKVFISHIPADRYFVDLLAELLRHHNIEVQQDADHFPEADYLLAVISRSSRSSEPMAQEIAAFQAKKGKANIIPILLDKVTPKQLPEGLRDIQGFPFYASMLEGFRGLLKVFDKEFLADPHNRSGMERRQDERRTMDRRKSGVSQRLRYGLWKLYEGETGCGKFDIAYLTLGERLKAIDVLQKEMQKYECFTREGDNYHLSKMELDRVTHDVWQELAKQNYLTSVIVIEALADRMLKQYELRPIDRRRADRRAGIDRRELPLQASPLSAP